jgi:hypothetical protein
MRHNVTGFHWVTTTFPFVLSEGIRIGSCIHSQTRKCGLLALKQLFHRFLHM